MLVCLYIVCLTTLYYTKTIFIGDKKYMYYMYCVNFHLAEIVSIDFALMMSQFTFNRPPLRIDTGGGDGDLSRYAAIYHVPLGQYDTADTSSTFPRMLFHSQVACHNYPLNLDVIVIRKEGANQSRCPDAPK